MAHLLVICAKRYNGHELWTLLGILNQRGHSFEVVSQETLIRDELTLRPNSIKRTVYEVSPSAADLKPFDSVVVVSGNMQDTEAYWTDDHVQKILATARQEDKVIAAICCSVPTLAPVARDVKVSFFPLVRSRQRLLKFGALLQPVSLTVDKRTVTAENQMITQMWAEEICNMLEGLEPTYDFQPTGFTTKKRDRRMPKPIMDMINQARNPEGGQK